MISSKKFLGAGILLWSIMNSPGFAEDWSYKVRPGDNIWNISERFLTSVLYWKKLQAKNHITDPRHIPPGTIVKIPIKWLNKSPMVARVRSAVGVVEITEDFNGKTREVRVGDYIFIDDALHTADNSTATIEFVDGSTLLIQPNSQLKFDLVGIYPGTGMTETWLKLEQGRVETNVAPQKGEASRFEIGTPAGVTSVRGTDYRVSAESAAAESRTEVVTGRVAVASQGKSRLVNQGFGIVASLSAPLKAPIPLLKPPELASLPAVVERIPIQLKINRLEGAGRFRVQLSPSFQFDTVIYDRTFQGQTGRILDLPDGHYFLRIRGIDQHLLEGLNAAYEFTLNARPEAPFLIEPGPDKGVTEATPRFVWAQLQSAQHYYFQMATDSAFTDVIIDAPQLSDAEFIPGENLALGQYFWRVASKNNEEGLGPFSDIQTFRRIMPAPEAEQPEISDTQLTMRWRNGLAGQKYQFQMAADSSFSSPLIDTVTDDAKLIIDRPQSGDYFVRIRTIEPDGFVGPYGEAQTIHVPVEFNFWWLLALPLLGLIAL